MMGGVPGILHAIYLIAYRDEIVAQKVVKVVYISREPQMDDQVVYIPQKGGAKVELRRTSVVSI